MSDESDDAGDRDIATLTHAKITDEEVKRLRGAGVKTVAQLRGRVTCEGLADLERKARIEGHRLVKLLPPKLAVELAEEVLFRAERDGLVPPSPKSAKRRRLPLGLRARRATGRAATWLRDHLLDLALLACVALVAFLLLRAFGNFSRLPPPWGLGRRYAVAARELKKGEALRPAQLDFARLPPAGDYFESAEGLEGLILARDVPRLKPLRREDLLRLQVVAARDIAPGETLAPSDFKTEWRPFQTEAVQSVSETENAKARLAVRKDDVVTSAHLAR